MSSEISIDAGRLKPASTPGGPVEARFPGLSDVEGSRPDSDLKAEEGFRPWHFFVLSSILLATVAVMLSRQSSPENLILISLTIASAGAAAAAFYRMLAPLTQPVVLRAGEPVTERERAALEREKMLVLRSIKELEFDRAMGKLSQKDFDEMAGRLRSRALTLIRQLDQQSGYLPVIEKELQGRLARRLKTGAVPVSSKAAAGAVRSESACANCAATNDIDAVFCKKCGVRLSA